MQEQTKMSDIAAAPPKSKSTSQLASMTSSKRRLCRLNREGSLPPLPLCWRMTEMTRKEAIALSLTDAHGVSAEEGEQIVAVYHQYKRPPETLCKDHRNYKYEEPNRISGAGTITRPLPQPLFHIDKDVLAAEPDDLILPRGRADGAPGARELQHRKLFERRCIADIYRSAFDLFKFMEIDASALNEERFIEASNLAMGIFGKEFTREQVQAWAFPEKPLIGEEYSYFAKSGNTGLPLYAQVIEDRLAFLCLGVKDLVWKPQPQGAENDSSAVGQGYPGAAWGLRPCIFTGGEESLPEEHLAAAKLLSEAVCKGVFVKDGNNWIERPGLGSLADYKITGLASKQYKKDCVAEAKPLLPNVERDGKTVLYEGQEVKLSACAWAILQLTISQVDKYVIPRFKSVLARRARGCERFPSFSLHQKRQLSDDKKKAVVVPIRSTKTRKLEMRVKELEKQMKKQEELFHTMIAGVPLKSLEQMATALAPEKQLIEPKGTLEDSRSAIVKAWVESSREGVSQVDLGDDDGDEEDDGEGQQGMATD